MGGHLLLIFLAVLFGTLAIVTSTKGKTKWTVLATHLVLFISPTALCVFMVSKEECGDMGYMLTIILGTIVMAVNTGALANLVGGGESHT